MRTIVFVLPILVCLNATPGLAQNGSGSLAYDKMLTQYDYPFPVKRKQW